MAVGTRRLGMHTRQLEDRGVMVESDRVPVLRHMTRFAIRSQLPFVMVVLFMARETILRRALELEVEVAVHTCCLRMHSLQVKDGAVMVEAGGFPAVGRMTGGAIVAQLPIVRLVLHMARSAILRGRPQGVYAL